MANRASNARLHFCKIRPLVSGPYCRQVRLITPQPRRRATRMEPSKVQYEFVEEVERLDYYVPGGYHPTMIGDELGAGRYVVAHKLGFGRSATTWLAEDRNQGQLVALKISTAESAERTHELQILLQLAKAESELPGKESAQNLIDSFTFSGPNGTHRCLVTDAARVNLDEAKDAAYHRLFHLPTARAIAAQLILGVQFIHSQGIVHGDLHLANILLRLPSDMRDMTLEQLRAKTREPARIPVIREDSAPLDLGVPPEIIVPVWLGLGSDEISLADSEIMIADFGEAFDPQITQQFTAHTPLLIAPPESRFAEPGGTDDPLSFPGDIWTLACTVWDILGDRPPFEAFPATSDEVTIEHVELLGQLPERWWRRWEKRRDWFDEDGRKNVKESLRQWYLNSTRDWNQRFSDSIQKPRERKKFDIFSAEEENAFRNMIKSMLVLEPSERATIEEVVLCEWMQRWGLPEVQKMRDALQQMENI